MDELFDFDDNHDHNDDDDDNDDIHTINDGNHAVINHGSHVVRDTERPQISVTNASSNAIHTTSTSSSSWSSLIPTGKDKIAPAPINNNNNNNNNSHSNGNNNVSSNRNQEIAIASPTQASRSELGWVGLKWRVRIVRIYDSEEQWKGVVELYFHWNRHVKVDADDVDHQVTPNNDNNARKRRGSTKITNGDLEIIDTPKHYPHFKIMNDEFSVSTEEIYFKAPADPLVYFGYLSFTVTIHERLELERYPFDRQFFKVELECANGDLTSWGNHYVASLLVNRLGDDCKQMNFFGVSDTPSWKLDIISVKRGDRSTAATMALGMSRLSGFYISNVCLPYFLIGAGAGLTVAIDNEDYANRMQAMVQLFLTIVAIKFVASFLPVISYSTLLDHYTLIAYVFLALWMVENFIVSPLVLGSIDAELARRVDIYCVIVYAILWISLHIVIWIGNSCDIFRKDWNSVEDDDDAENPDAHKEAADFAS